jgi:CheY-like chemotaxis protein
VGIHDTGIGIRPDDLKRLFLPFEQLDMRKNKYIAGTGLGLAISRKLCELMGGRLSVESAYGAGTTFTVDIPCIARTENMAIDESKEKIAEFSAKEANVLVVDDIEINLSVAEAMLQIFEITPDLTLRGAEAVEMAAKKQYDLIFMDHMMPEMDGFETMKQIRTIGRYEFIPIVALTANVINNAEQMFLENGFNGFIPKPIDINALNLCLRKFLPGNLIESLAPGK